jgi:hypothetical protein
MAFWKVMAKGMIKRNQQLGKKSTTLERLVEQIS